jgi:signal-transduction protein with cAMP-binding, CBS, and nucleotidyltransferase domain
MKRAQDLVKEKGAHLIAISVDATIRDALKLMVAKHVGAVLVFDGDEDNIVGIWTERDFLRNSIVDEFDPSHSRVGDYMTKDLFTVESSENIYRMMDKFLGLRVRHLPVTQDGKIIALLSAGDVIKAALHDKTKEFNDLNEMVSWEYYENWRWSK